MIMTSSLPTYVASGTQIATLGLVVGILLTWFPTPTHAFSTAYVQSPLSKKCTQLQAWTLPDASAMASSLSVGSTWYSEYNPTHRRTSYDDDRVDEFAFVALGDDWPSSFNDDSNAKSDVSNKSADNYTPRRRRFNPLRAVARKLRRNRNA